MKTVLTRYLNQEVGINYRKPYHIHSATLVEVGEGCFSVRCPEDGAVHVFPYNNVLRVIYREEGVEVGGLFAHHKRYPVVIKVGHLVDVAPMV